MTEQKSFKWNDRYLLGYPTMDNTHREFVALVDALLSVETDGLDAALTAFAQHAEAHFGQENRWMEQDGFPARDCHVNEHNKVLASIREVQQGLTEGKAQLVRELALALIEWFPAHADYMDSALSTWLVKRSHGGKPLIFRRVGRNG